MGTFRIRALSIQSQINILQYWLGVGGIVNAAPSNADLLTILNTFPLDSAHFFYLNETNIGSPQAGEVIVTAPDSDGIYLDGSATPTPEISLPVGFNILTAILNHEFSRAGTQDVTLKIGALLGTVNAVTMNFPAPVTLAGILTSSYGAVFNAGSNVYLGSSLYITGTYDLSGFTWVLSSDMYAPGENVTISSPDEQPDLTTVTEVILEYTDADGNPQEIIVPSTDFLNWTTTNLSFLLPEELNDIVETEITISGNFFSGSVLVGTIFILLEDGSGIYRIVANKTNDTLYVNAPVDDTTVDVKIPNPFIKTGFIGG